MRRTANALTKEEALRTVTEGISWLTAQCKLNGLLHLFDTNTISHEFFRRLLNEVYDLKLVVMDRIQQNFPAIDLGDEENKQSFQVTTEKDGEKMQATLNTYVRHGLVERFGKLHVLVIGDRQGSYSKLDVPEPLQFAWEDDIIDTKALLKKIEELPIEKLQRVAEVVRSELKLGAAPAREINVRGGGCGSIIQNTGDGVGLDIAHDKNSPAERITVEGTGVGEITINTGSGTGKRINTTGPGPASQGRVVVDKPVKMVAAMMTGAIIMGCESCGRDFRVMKVVQGFAGDATPKVEVKCPHCGALASI